jgi:hypothetical protein
LGWFAGAVVLAIVGISLIAPTGLRQIFYAEPDKWFIPPAVEFEMKFISPRSQLRS